MGGRVLPRRPGDPRRLGPYELVGRLGEGGMGVVFLGRERRGGRLAAVKALRQELAGDATFAARFRREVEAASRVASPRVARVLGADLAGSPPWLATEHVDGPTVAAAVAAGGPLSGGRLLGLAAGVAEALAVIHAAGVVHRDLKPSNVLLEDHPADGPGVKVIDFGIASAADATLTRSGLRFGTPSWMAPEQLRDQPAGPAADVFAWGALVAFAAGGRHPFGGGPSEAVAYRILRDPPDLAGVPGSLRRLVAAALSGDPAARPTAEGLAATLGAALAPTLPLPATTPTRVLAAAPVGSGGGPARPGRPRRVGPLLVALALLVGLVTAPHVVLAAVDGDHDQPTRHGKVCSDEREHDEDAADDDRGEEETDEAEAEEAEEAAEPQEEAQRPPDRGGRQDGDGMGDRQDGGGAGGRVARERGRDQPAQGPGNPGQVGPAGPVLGS